MSCRTRADSSSVDSPMMGCTKLLQPSNGQLLSSTRGLPDARRRHSGTLCLWRFSSCFPRTSSCSHTHFLISSSTDAPNEVDRISKSLVARYESFGFGAGSGAGAICGICGTAVAMRGTVHRTEHVVQVRIRREFDVVKIYQVDSDLRGPQLEVSHTVRVSEVVPASRRYAAVFDAEWLAHLIAASAGVAIPESVLLCDCPLRHFPAAHVLQSCGRLPERIKHVNRASRVRIVFRNKFFLTRVIPELRVPEKCLQPFDAVAHRAVGVIALQREYVERFRFVAAVALVQIKLHVPRGVGCEMKLMQTPTARGFVNRVHQFAVRNFLRPHCEQIYFIALAVVAHDENYVRATPPLLRVRESHNHAFVQNAHVQFAERFSVVLVVFEQQKVSQVS